MGFNGNSIYWKDWTTMGINLLSQSGVKHGDHLKVRIIARGCTAGGHYCYGYFTLNCASATIETDQCSGNPKVTAEAPLGFTYTWFKEKNRDLFERGVGTDADGEKVVVSREADLNVVAGDTNIYVCRMVDLIEPSCYFELKTRLSPRSPMPMFRHTPVVVNCQNVVQFKDSARVMDYGADGRVQITAEPCEFSDFTIRSLVSGKQYTNSNQMFTFVAEPTGDTLLVTQTSYMEDATCVKTKDTTIVIPDITSRDSIITDTVCRNIGYTFYGERLIQTGTYTHRMKNRFGCDSLEILNLTVNPVSNATVLDTISSLQLPYVLQGIYKGDPTTYERGHEDDYATTQNYTVKFSNTYECDSTVNLSLTVIPQLSVLVDELGPMCADDGGVVLGYYIMHGDFDSLQIVFDNTAHRQGFQDITIYHNPYAPLEVSEQHIPYSYNSTILPAVYNAQMRFFQHPVCGENVIEPIVLDIRYSSSVLQEKWCDAILLRNKDYNGGYSFTEYQWYKNGLPIEGATKAYLQEDEGLDPNAEYCVLLTRASDGVRQFTCPIVPDRCTDVPSVVTPDNLIPTLVTSGQIVTVHIGKPAKAYIYTPTGELHSVQDVVSEEGGLNMPYGEGCHFLRIICADGTTYAQKILVTP